MEAHEYYLLSRAALLFSSPCTTTTLHTVFAMVRRLPQCSGCVTVTLTKQENGLQWLHLSDLEMDLTRIYIFAGLGVKIAYRVSAFWAT